ncbi:hypothetical protein [Halosimplex sp. J119]
MRRRTVLAALPTAALALSGCSDAVGTTDTAEPRDSSSELTPKPARKAIQQSFEFDHTESESTGGSAVGSKAAATDADASLPWYVLVWNDADEARSITVSVFGASLGQALAKTVELPPNAHHSVRLFEADTYTVQIQAADRARHEFRIPADRFDCNSHTTQVRVAPTGDVQYVESSTMVACSVTVE